MPARDIAALASAPSANVVAEGSAIQRRLELPRHVFAKLGDQKPFYCDFRSMFSLEVLANECRKHDGSVVFTEMLPAPDELWLKFEDGAYTSELRFIATIDGDSYAGRGNQLRDDPDL